MTADTITAENQDEFIDDQPPIGRLTPEARESLRLAIESTPPGQLAKWRPTFVTSAIVNETIANLTIEAR
jgi:hypothetical protein